MSDTPEPVTGCVHTLGITVWTTSPTRCGAVRGQPDPRTGLPVDNGGRRHTHPNPSPADRGCPEPASTGVGDGDTPSHLGVDPLSTLCTPPMTTTPVLLQRDVPGPPPRADLWTDRPSPLGRAVAAPRSRPTVGWTTSAREARCVPPNGAAGTTTDRPGSRGRPRRYRRLAGTGAPEPRAGVRSDLTPGRGPGGQHTTRSFPRSPRRPGCRLSERGCSVEA